MIVNEPLTIAGLTGLIAPFLTAIVTRTHMLPAYKRLIALAVTVLLVVLGIVATQWPDTWAQLGAIIASSIGVMQVVYTGLKPALEAVEASVNNGTSTTPPPPQPQPEREDDSGYTPRHAERERRGR